MVKPAYFLIFLIICGGGFLLAGGAFAQEEEADAVTPPATARPANVADIVATGEERAFSPAEIHLLQDLERERIKLERRSQALELREKLVDLAEERMTQKIETLTTLQSQLEALLGNLSDKEDAELQQLSQIYEAMKPDAAAEVLNRLDNAIVFDIIKRMNNKKSAKVMEAMSIPKARFISEMMAEENLLPKMTDKPSQQ